MDPAPSDPLVTPAQPIPAGPLNYATSTAKPSHRGKGSLAVAATLIFPGIGHVFAGQRRRGVRWMIAALVTFLLTAAIFLFPALAPMLIFLLPLHVLITLGSLIDAYRCGRRSDRRMFGPPPLRYVITVILLVVALQFHPMGLAAYWMRDHWMETFIVSSASMSPTIIPRDRFMVHKTVPPRRWSLIAYHYPERPSEIYISRLVGLPGEQVELREGKVYINGKEVAPPPGVGPYVSTITAHGGKGNGCEGNPIRLKSDEHYVLGDNSPIAADSRYWRGAVQGHQPGAVPASYIIGRATWTYWPISRWRRIEP